MNREVLSAALKTIVRDMEVKEAKKYLAKRKAKSKAQSVPGKSSGDVRKAEVVEEEGEIE